MKNLRMEGLILITELEYKNNKKQKIHNEVKAKYSIWDMYDIH